jgi:hypothetical protein
MVALSRLEAAFHNGALWANASPRRRDLVGGPVSVLFLKPP